MAVGLYSGVSGLALGTGLYNGVSGLWGGSSGLVSGFGSGSPYSGASLYLDFLSMTAATFDSRITFSRGTTATRVNASGLVETVAINVPRFDFDPTTLAPRGLLIEEQRTNLIIYSEQFDNAAWSKARITVTANTQTAPDGTSTADVLTANTGTSDNVSQSVTLAAVVYTGSIYLKGTATATTALIGLFSGSFLASSGQIVSGPGSISGSGLMSVSGLSTTQWTRIAFTLTAAAPAGAASLLIYPGSGSTVGAAVIAWGAQLEAGAFVTSYIPTVASTVTRTADNASMTGANFSGWFNPSQGTFALAAEVANPTAIGNNGIIASDGTSNNRIQSNLGTINHLFVSTGGVLQAAIDAGSFPSGIGKLAAAYRVDDFAACIGGGAVATDTSGSVPSVLNQFWIGSLNGTAPITGRFRSIVYYNTRLSNTQLQALTA